jgi:hypothetical protein
MIKLSENSSFLTVGEEHEDFVRENKLRTLAGRWQWLQLNVILAMVGELIGLEAGVIPSLIFVLGVYTTKSAA